MSSRDEFDRRRPDLVALVIVAGVVGTVLGLFTLLALLLLELLKV